MLPIDNSKTAMIIAERIKMESEFLAIAHDERPDDRSVVTVSIGIVAFTRQRSVEKVEGWYVGSDLHIQCKSQRTKLHTTF